MTVENPQKRSGTTYIPGGDGTDKGTPMTDPLSGGGKDVQTTTHYPFTKEQVSSEKSGKRLEGQDLRGYVHNEANTNIGAVDDATVAPDGTKRVKDIG